MDSSRVAALSFFAGLPGAELDAVARVGTEIEFATGDSLAKADDFGHSLFVLESGSADVLIDGTKVGGVASGDIVGEVAVLTSGRRTASVVATAPIRALAFFKRDVWTLEREAPETISRMRSTIVERLDNQAPAPSAD